MDRDRALSTFCWISAALYALGALGFAALPRLTFRVVTLNRAPLGWTAQALFWNVLAVAMMTAIATACALAAPRPVERRWLLLPVAVAKLTSSLLAALHLIRFRAPGAQALAAVIATDLPLFVLTLLAFRAAGRSGR